MGGKIFYKEDGMGKLYTLDDKLLTEVPEVRVGDKVYPVDNRQKTVMQIQRVMAKADAEPENQLGEAFRLALGAQAAKELEEKNLPYPAVQELFALVLAAVTGEDAEVVRRRFRTAREQV